MKDLIRKILKENEDDFSWADVDENKGKEDIYSTWQACESEWGVDLDEIFNLIEDSGIQNVRNLKEVGDLLYTQFDRVYDNGRDYGYDSCDCDGCCDDYVWYETYDEDVRTAKEEGYDDGYDTARSEFQSQIEELQSRIEELESQLNENINKKNTKRI